MGGHEYPSLPLREWLVDEEKLRSKGIEPGVYEHYQGGEYLTLSTGWRMVEGADGDAVGEEVVWYVALYEHPEYGAYAEWDRPIEDFRQGTVEIDGQQVPKFVYARPN